MMVESKSAEKLDEPSLKTQDDFTEGYEDINSQLQLDETIQYPHSEFLTISYINYPLFQLLYSPQLQTCSMELIYDKQRKKREIKHYILNLDNDSQQFKVIQEYLPESSKGAYSKIDIVQDCHNRLIIRKKVFDDVAFINELLFFQENQNKFIVNIYYYSKFDQQFYLEKGQHTVQSLFKFQNIKNQFFILLLCLSIIEAVKTLHLNNIFHGDIKPSNIIILEQNEFDLSNLKQDNNIDWSTAEQFFSLQNFVEFEIRNSINQNDIKKSQSIKYQELYKVLEQTKIKSMTKSYQSYNEMLLSQFKVTIKFIDFQSSSPLNYPQKITFFTNAFANQILLPKMKSKNFSVIDKILLDQYSCLRTLLMIAQNLEVNEPFLKFNDKQCIENIKDSILKSIIQSYYSIFESELSKSNQDSNENVNQINLEQKYKCIVNN